MKDIWEESLYLLAQKVNQKSFDVWLKPLRILTLAEEQIEIEVPNKFFKDWLSENYLNLIKETLFQITSRRYSIHFTLKNGVEEKEIKNKEDDKPSSNMIRNSKPALREDGVNPQFAFDAFVVGSCNQFAHAAALAVANLPAKNYNPLFIYGGVGLGKTHLIQSVGNKCVVSSPERKVRYTTTERFTTEIIGAIRNLNIDKLKENYRKFDILIIDDVQFLAGKEKTQEEFFHIFNTLYEANKQIILSSDRPPQAIAALAERLRSRFEGGMITDISSPDLESRIAILAQKAHDKNLNIGGEILEYIAQNVQNNIRQLEGALNRLTAYQKFGSQPLDTEAAKKLLRKIIQPEQKRASYQKIIQFVAEFYNLNPKDLFQNSRKKEIVKPRQVAMYFLRKEVNYSFPYIGKKFGGKDHTTAIYAYEKIAQEVEKNETVAQEINVIKEKIYAQ